MTKEEILAKSRNENKGMDEREQDIHTKANNLGGTVGLMVAMILAIINEIADGPEVVRYVIWAVYWSNHLFNYGYQAFHLKKRSYWFYTILVALAAVASCWAFLKITLGW